MQRILLKLSLLAFTVFAISRSSATARTEGGGKSVTVSGVVTSAEDKQPLIGVSVISGPSSGVTTLADGKFSIQVAPGTKLTFQYIGYKPVEYLVPQGRSSVTYNLEMQSEAQALDDVVVIAYGVRKKGSITGSVSTVKAEKFADTPTAAFDQALQGQAPGLSVISNSGEPSKAAVFQIRGTNSINSGTSPLFILDGVPIESSDFNAINPGDIESITVLKDASSTSIYGARAANGVVVITTKRGHSMDQAQVAFRAQYGFSQLARAKWNMMNTAERIRFEKEVGLDAGQDYDVLSRTDVNWLDAVFNDSAPLQSYEVSVNRATENLNYYVSGGFYDAEGIAQSSSFRRYTLRANTDAKVARWLKMGTNTMLTYEEAEQADEGEPALSSPIFACRLMLPYWNPYREDGSIASQGDGSWTGTGVNPLEYMANNPVKNKKYKLISTIYGEVTPIENLTIRAQLGVDFSHSTGFGQSYPSYIINNGDGSAGRAPPTF